MRKWMVLIAAALLLACMLVPSVRFTEDNDTVLLAKVIYAQCKNEDYSAKLALGREVMRRVDDPWYPATLGEVLREQQQFRITLSAVWTVLNLIYAGIAFQQGHFTGDVVQIIVFCVPLAVLATFLGSKLQKKISQERFLKLTYVLLLCVGVILLVTS